MLSLAMGATTVFAADKADYKVVPLPQSVALQNGDAYVLTAATKVCYPKQNEEMARNAKFLADYVSDVTGIALTTTTDKVKGAAIRLVIDKKIAGDEAYRLVVDKKNGITLSASTAKGIFYGIQTLRKALPVEKATQVEMPAVVVNDSPTFSYRGMMLDCSRHFFPMWFVKQYIDLLAMHNMNVFHWHLSDDQGWRIEIKKYPRLTTVGSVRANTTIGHNTELNDSTPYGGYYTQDQAREIVEYARQRYITVIPEIDMPGHMKAALAAYPELGCTGGPYEVGTRWGIYADVFCVGNEKVYQFCEDVWSELMQIFPSTYIHIGGDETPTTRWADCPKCKKVMADNGLNIKNLQGYFTNRIEKFLNANGRRMIGWDEILGGKINQSATIMSWRDMKQGIDAAYKGHDVIFSPTSHMYFDYCQSQKNYQYEPTRCGGDLSVEKVYSLKVCADTVSADVRKHIIGVQANLWTEHVPNAQVAEYQVLPRMAALADVNWTYGEKDFEGFKARVDRMLKLYDLYHLTYAKHMWPERMLSPYADN